MQKRIIKIIFTDGEILELTPIPKALVFDGTESQQEKFKERINQQKYFDRFDKKIIRYLDEEIIKNYAKDTFDLIDEDDCDCPKNKSDLSDFSMEEIIDDIMYNNNINNTILSTSFIYRFINIMKQSNPIIIDGILSDLETKNNIF